MSTYVLENQLLRAVRSLLSSPTPVIPQGLELVDGRLYMPVKGVQLKGWLMVDGTRNRVTTVYDQSGNFRRNFQAREQDIQVMLKLLGK